MNRARRQTTVTVVSRGYGPFFRPTITTDYLCGILHFTTRAHKCIATNLQMYFCFTTSHSFRCLTSCLALSGRGCGAGGVATDRDLFTQVERIGVLGASHLVLGSQRSREGDAIHAVGPAGGQESRRSARRWAVKRKHNCITANRFSTAFLRQSVGHTATWAPRSSRAAITKTRSPRIVISWYWP